jgi:acetyl esterase/lipase
VERFDRRNHGAKHFADLGMVSVSAQYRLSDQKAVTTLKGVQRFCDRMKAAGNRCELHIYDDVGHLFTPASERDDGTPNPDPDVQAEAYLEADRFLASLGFIYRK